MSSSEAGEGLTVDYRRFCWGAASFSLRGSDNSVRIVGRWLADSISLQQQQSNEHVDLVGQRRPRGRLMHPVRVHAIFSNRLSTKANHQTFEPNCGLVNQVLGTLS